MKKQVEEKSWNSIWLRVGMCVLAVCLLFGVVYLRQTNQMRQAQFNVDVLQRYIQAYKIVEGKQIESLQDLPDFHLISPPESLSLKAADVRQGVFCGYIYDMQYLGQERYVISASPIGLLAPGIEFASTDQSVLRVNNKNADVDADSYDEVAKWQALPHEQGVRTKELPDYLK